MITPFDWWFLRYCPHCFCYIPNDKYVSWVCFTAKRSYYGWLRNLAPVGRWVIGLSHYSYQDSYQLVQDFDGFCASTVNKSVFFFSTACVPNGRWAVRWTSVRLAGPGWEVTATSRAQSTIIDPGQVPVSVWSNPRTVQCGWYQLFLDIFGAGTPKWDVGES
jgi:hypothetical protein